MTSLASEEEPDSRTSSVSRKRGINQLTVSEDSSGEDIQQRVKRAHYSEDGEIDARQNNTTSESPTDALVFSDKSAVACPPQGQHSTASSEAASAYSNKIADTVKTISPPTWNPGVSVAIRTSLTDILPKLELPSAQMNAVSQTLLCNVTNTFPEQVVDTNSKLESKDELQEPHKHEQELENGLEPKKREKSKSIKGEGKKEVNRLKTESRILAQLPSSFGTSSKQKEAEEIIRGLPEASKDLMPREVPATSFSFSEMGRTVKLPQVLHKDLPVVSLAKLSFCNPSHSFVMPFLKENQHILDYVDFKLLVRAFHEYLRLLYGHLPDRLISIVCSSKHVVGPKAERICLKLLGGARKNIPRIAETEKAYQGKQNQQLENKRTETGAMKADPRKTQIQVSELKRPAKATKETEMGNGDTKNLTAEAEHRKMPIESQAYTALEQQSQSGTLGPEIPSKLLTSLNGQSYEIMNKSHDSEPYSMGRLLGIKRAQSQAISIRIADSEHNTARKIPDEQQLNSGKMALSDNELGNAGSSNQVDVEQNLISSSTNIELIRRYHPSSDGTPIMHYCLTCSQTDHDTLDCPSLTCANCGLHGVHFTEGCPKRQRCKKCHERGHQQAECLEKLAATADESLCCDICLSSRHLESACHFLWRSFKPDMLNNIRLVAEIPIHCYACGAESHFGSECGIRHSPLNTDGYSWSRTNWKRYVDPQSHNRAPAAGKDFNFPVSSKGKKSFSIRGSAQNGTSTTMDDDENIPFIREKVTKPVRPIPRGSQHIKFDQNWQNSDKLSLPHLDPSLSGSRIQSHRATPSRTSYAEDRREFSYRSRPDSARHLREGTFSPPPRFHEERYLPRYGGDNHRTDESIDSYRPYNRDISRSSIPARVPRGSINQNQGFTYRGTAQDGREDAGAPRGKRQRNRAG